MKTGEMYKWETSKAQGHEVRYKYHLYIGKNSRNQNIFLYVNSINYFEEGFELLNIDYPFFSKCASYIGCTSTILYTDSEIKDLKGKDCLGQLNQEHVVLLHEHITKSEILEKREIDFICSFLKNVISEP